MADAPSTSAVVLAYGAEPDLPACLRSLRDNGPDDLDVVLVDNGCTRADLPEVADEYGATIVTPSENLGFAGGCNVGAKRARGALLVFVNSDAFIEPGCIEALAETVADPLVGVASACIVLEDDPGTVNSVGNPVHVSGLTWAGGFGEPVERHSRATSVTSATGCVMAVRRERWEELGGFWSDLFAYLEDTELSLRCRQRGLDVRYVPSARARHRYEFSRNDLKLYLLERNRLLLLATLYERRTLLRLAPALLLVELTMLALAARQGWLGEKLRGMWWIVRHWGLIRTRRGENRRLRTVPDGAILPLLERRIAPTNVERPPGLGALNAVIGAWCRIALPQARRN